MTPKPRVNRVSLLSKPLPPERKIEEDPEERYKVGKWTPLRKNEEIVPPLTAQSVANFMGARAMQSCTVDARVHQVLAQRRRAGDSLRNGCADGSTDPSASCNRVVVHDLERASLLHRLRRQPHGRQRHRLPAVLSRVTFSTVFALFDSNPVLYNCIILQWSVIVQVPALAVVRPRALA